MDWSRWIEYACIVTSVPSGRKYPATTAPSLLTLRSRGPGKVGHKRNTSLRNALKSGSDSRPLKLGQLVMSSITSFSSSRKRCCRSARFESSKLMAVLKIQKMNDGVSDSPCVGHGSRSRIAPSDKDRPRLPCPNISAAMQNALKRLTSVATRSIVSLGFFSDAR